MKKPIVLSMPFKAVVIVMLLTAVYSIAASGALWGGRSLAPNYPEIRYVVDAEPNYPILGYSEQTDFSAEISLIKQERPIEISTPAVPMINHRDVCRDPEHNMYDRNPLTGFIDDWGYCVPGLVTNETWFTRSPQYVYGSAVWYAPGMMEATARWRSPEMYKLAYRSGQYKGGVAVPSPANIGDTVWIRRAGGDWDGPYLVVDCSRRADMFSQIMYNQQVVEVDFNTAVAWGLAEGDWQDWKMIKGKEETVELWYGTERPRDYQHYIEPPIFFARYWIEQVAKFQSGKVEPSPVFYSNGLNPEWNLRDGKGRQCFTEFCLTNSP